MIPPITHFALTQTWRVSGLASSFSFYQQSSLLSFLRGCLLSITGPRVIEKNGARGRGAHGEGMNIWICEGGSQVKAFLKPNKTGPFAQMFSTPAPSWALESPRSFHKGCCWFSTERFWRNCFEVRPRHPLVFPALQVILKGSQIMNDAFRAGLLRKHCRARKSRAWGGR